MTFSAEYEEQAPASELASVGDCLALARHLHESGIAGRPIGAHFYRSDGESLFIVFGAEVSCMVWFPANYSDTGLGSFSSGKDVDDNEPLDYWFCGHHGQVHPENAITISNAFSALEQFLHNGGQPEAIDWIAD